MEFFRDFALSQGAQFQNLLLASADLSPRKAAGSFDDGLDGWAYMMRTADKKTAFLYFENGCAASITVSGMLPKTDYTAQWFDTWTGAWTAMGTGTKTTDSIGALVLPVYPTRANAANTNDWAATLAVKSNTGTTRPTFDMPGRPLLEIDRNTVRVYLQSRSEATIDLVTMNGKRVKLLHQGILPEGSRLREKGSASRERLLSTGDRKRQRTGPSVTVHLRQFFRLHGFVAADKVAGVDASA
jgi:hypothetical protein